MNKAASCLVLIVLLFYSISAQQSRYTLSDSRGSTNSSIERLEKDIPRLMKEADVPGMSAALIRDGKLVWSRSFGVKNAETKEPVTNDTIFEAASLSKVVAAYGVLKLVDEGKLDLDVPLNKYLGSNYDVGDDPRLNLITARRVLSHTSGFPNWRREDSKTLPINFTPGEKFSYSGEGFVYLSKVVEKLTNMSFEDYMQKTVLIPLGMTSSSFVWQDKYETQAAYRHNALGNKSFRNQRKDVNAAASLRTTAEDYARFVIALLNGQGLKKATWNEMLKPQIKVNDKYPQLSWGLGVGLETMEEGKYFWHWGDQGDSKCFVAALVKPEDAIVFFTNGRNGLSFAQEILENAIGGKHPALANLNYERYDSPGRVLLKSVLANGAAAALRDYREKRKQNGGEAVSESQTNNMGYALLQLKRVDDAIAVFEQNTADFPQSANTWDSLAEAYMIKGEKELAIKYYEKSLALDPNNKNAVEQLKKLKS
jgi:CubicO group peptidase (beta-lactamase class C family)